MPRDLFGELFGDLLKGADLSADRRSGLDRIAAEAAAQVVESLRPTLAEVQRATIDRDVYEVLRRAVGLYAYAVRNAKAGGFLIARKTREGGSKMSVLENRGNVVRAGTSPIPYLQCGMVVLCTDANTQWDVRAIVSYGMGTRLVAELQSGRTFRRVLANTVREHYRLVEDFDPDATRDLEGPLRG